MRPVDKWNEGDSLELNGQTVDVLSDYDPYTDAKALLIQNLGTYCSYCEDAYHQDRDLQVEHIQPKNYKENGVYKYAHLTTKWENFLLSCATCNGADNKDTKDVVYGECHLPHLNNTFLSFRYLNGGVVVVNPELKGSSKENAAKLLYLVGLNKSPKESNRGDTRWKKRMEDWRLANRYLGKYERHECDEETIVELVRDRGGWSIWFTVFIEHRDVRRALVEQIDGTSRKCFDNDYNPIFRNPENLIDPV